MTDPLDSADETPDTALAAAAAALGVPPTRGAPTPLSDPPAVVVECPIDRCASIAGGTTASDADAALERHIADQHPRGRP